MKGAAGWLFVGPALAIIGVFFLAPVAAAFGLSLTDFDIYALADLHNLRFIGVTNYRTLLATPLFWRALGNTLYFVAIGAPLSIAASLGAALLLDSKLARFKGFFRSALFAPVVTTLVAVAVIWRYLLHARYGLIDYALHTVGLPAMQARAPLERHRRARSYPAEARMAAPVTATPDGTAQDGGRPVTSVDGPRLHLIGLVRVEAASVLVHLAPSR